MDGDLFSVCTVSVDFLEDIRLDVLNLDRQDVAMGSQLTDLGGVFKGAGRMLGVAVDLFGRRVFGIQNGNFNVQRRGCFAQHAAQLAASQKTNHWLGENHWGKW